MTDVRPAFIAKRYAAERRFRYYGMAALALTAAFLAFLLIDMLEEALELAGRAAPGLNTALLVWAVAGLTWATLA